MRGRDKRGTQCSEPEGTAETGSLLRRLTKLDTGHWEAMQLGLRE